MRKRQNFNYLSVLYFSDEKKSHYLGLKITHSILWLGIKLSAIVGLVGCVAVTDIATPDNWISDQNAQQQSIMVMQKTNNKANPTLLGKQSIQNQEWQCSQDIKRNGELEHFEHCQNAEQKWACYEETTETCIDKNTDKIKRLKRKIFTRCAKLSDCW